MFAYEDSEKEIILLKLPSKALQNNFVSSLRVKMELKLSYSRDNKNCKSWGIFFDHNTFY